MAELKERYADFEAENPAFEIPMRQLPYDWAVEMAAHKGMPVGVLIDRALLAYQRNFQRGAPHEFRPFVVGEAVDPLRCWLCYATEDHRVHQESFEDWQARMEAGVEALVPKNFFLDELETPRYDIVERGPDQQGLETRGE